MSITAKELAKKLGLSTAAVSLALNNKPGVSTATRRRVLDAAHEYGYDFSRVNEKTAMHGSIYFIIYKKHGTVVADTPFFAEVSEGISAECRRRGCPLRVDYIYEDEDTLSRQLEDLLVSDCSGILLLGTEMESRDVRPFLELPMPLVLVDSYFDSTACSSVLINNVQGAYIATRYLIKMCKTQPGHLQSSYPISNFTERRTGFLAAVRESGMSEYKSPTHSLTPSLEGAEEDMLRIIDSGEDLASSYFADNDLIAAGAMRAFRKRGYDIPEDISIVGFDNMPVAAATDPGLTTVHVPKKYLGETAAARLISLVNSPGQPPVKTEISTTLIERGSVRRRTAKDHSS